MYSQLPNQRPRNNSTTLHLLLLLGPTTDACFTNKKLKGLTPRAVFQITWQSVYQNFKPELFWSNEAKQINGCISMRLSYQTIMWPKTEAAYEQDNGLHWICTDVCCNVTSFSNKFTRHSVVFLAFCLQLIVHCKYINVPLFIIKSHFITC